MSLWFGVGTIIGLQLGATLAWTLFKQHLLRLRQEFQGRIDVMELQIIHRYADLHADLRVLAKQRHIQDSSRPVEDSKEDKPS
jgi:hypothetical protein